MAHESRVFEKVTEARTRAMNAGSGKEKLAAENILSGTLKTLFAVSENYPQLRANENFLQLQAELTDTEDKIQAARRFYNGNVRDLNTAIQVFPTNLIASTFDFVGEGRVVLEIKASNMFYPRDIKQVLAYLQSANINLGILANFTRSGLKLKRILKGFK